MSRAHCPDPPACRAGARGPCACRPGIGRPRDDARRARVREAYRGGATLRTIAAAEGISFQRVHQILGAIGETPRRRGRAA